MIGITTFGDDRLMPSLARFKVQADAMNFFDRVSINSEADLPLWYRREHADRMFQGSRGFGYWCWKPFIILQTLEKMPEISTLFYSDVGCHVRVEGRARLAEYAETLRGSSHDLLAFQGSIEGAYFKYDGRRLPNLKESLWTKGDVFHTFGIDENHPNANSAQFGCGIFGVKNNECVKDMLRTWINQTKQNPHLFNDDASTRPNFNGFIEGRHDQSYFSLCAKQMGAVVFSAFEYWYPEHTEESADIFRAKADWKEIDRSPFFAVRDRPIALWRRGAYMARRIVGRAFGKRSNY
jgi:hypothetical protein